MVLAESIVHLPVSARNRKRISEARPINEGLDMSTGDSWLRVYDNEGRPLKLTLLYL